MISEPAAPVRAGFSESSAVRHLCQLYGILLYAYPRRFRTRFGDEMRTAFRDHCRDAARAHSGAPPWSFFIRTAWDWMITAARERTAEAWAGRPPVKLGYAMAWLLTMGLYLFVTTTLVQAYVVPTGSMEGSLRVGDHMLVNHRVHTGDVQRGDIVAFLYPEDVRQTFVKRVIGMPGDRIRLVDRQVIRNGRRLVEPYTLHAASTRDPYRDDFPIVPASGTANARDMFEHHVVNGEAVVPPGALFVMGDHRDNSLDSRYWGFVPRENVVGKPLLVYWSYDAPTQDLQNWNAAHFLDVARHFFAKTRWERTLFVPRSQQAQEEEP